MLEEKADALVRAALALGARLDVGATCGAILDAVERLFDARSAWILLHDPDDHCLRTVDFRGPGAETYANVTLPCDRGIVGLAFSRGETVFVPDVQADDRWFDASRVHASGLRSVLTSPLKHDVETIGVVGLDSARFSAERPPADADLNVLCALAAMAAVGIKNAQLFENAQEDRARLRRLLQERRTLRSEVGQLRHELRDMHGSGHIVGQSPAFAHVLSQVDVVAPSDTTVLLTGETGTGKEIVARAIHERSRRAKAAFIAVNCAALPETLVESELFGHEKGAFTGAVARKPGKFELAERGTLFLDEIGDLPLEAQAKLLRVLQEREVQRVGGTRSVAVNVRLVAATNQDLATALTEGRFRMDLYYRLSVFPIAIPPLRERPDDVPVLAHHFVRHFAERLNTRVPRLSDEALAQMCAYDWPGNVRELQNVIERAVLLANGQVIRGDVLPHGRLARSHSVPTLTSTAADAAPAAPPPEPGRRAATTPGTVIPFSDAERLAILRALESSGWRISGRGGAAQLLGLKPTTLHAKMKKLGIHRPSIEHSA